MGRDRLGGKRTLNVGSFLNEFEKDEIKQKIDIVRLFEHFGIKLSRKGKNYTGLCPWHDDKDPSLSVDRGKGFYNCFGCGESGDQFTLVMKMKDMDFKEALAFLKSMSGKTIIANAIKQEEAKQHVVSDISLNTAAERYHKTIYTNNKAITYLTATRMIKAELISRFKIGYADGSLLKIASNGQKEAFTDLHIFKTSEKGKVWEHFAGCITFPITDEAGRVVHFYGRKIAKAKVEHLYLTGTHKSIFNRKASCVYDEIILVESIIDCLSLISMGIENVQPLYGIGTLTCEHIKILKEHRIKTIILAFDADDAGRKGSEKHTQKLLEEGFSIKTIFPPSGKDWNDCLLAGTDKDAINKLIEESPVKIPKDKGKGLKVTKDDIRYLFTVANITYRIMGLKEIFYGNLRVQIKSKYEEETYWDSVDLYSSKSRASYSNKLAEVYDMEAKIIEKHLIMILEYLEDERDKKLAHLNAKGDVAPLTEEECKLGMDFLTASDMFEQIVKDMEVLGYTGEEMNKQLIYIAASSRKLEDPISILIISSSSAGKSFLVETVRRLMPEEDVISVTSLSDQALNYIPDGGLVHKFLILGEAVHSDIIEHQIRDMLSDHKLSRMVTVKDEKTGKMISENLKAECIVAIVMSSTRHEINPENASRCFVINADETEEQTERIHILQRSKYSLNRYFEKKHIVPKVIKKHTAAQRLLRNIIIVNPFSKYLNFPKRQIRTRRDNDRFMDLIACTCFLRQYQKEIKTMEDEKTGDKVEYIECDLIDYKIAYNITVNGILSSTFSELPLSVINLYDEVRMIFQKTALEHNLKPLEVSLTQRDIRAKVKSMSASSIREGMRKLVTLEYLQRERGGSRGMRNTYRLVADEPVEKLDYNMIPKPEDIKKKIAGDEYNLF